MVIIKVCRTLSSGCRRGDLMKFGTSLDAEGRFFDTVHFPQTLVKYPLRSAGIYLIEVIVHEILPMIAFIKQLAKFSYVGQALIYNWMWGGESVMAFVKIQHGQALLQPVTGSAQIDCEILTDIDSSLQVVADNGYNKQNN